MSRSRGIPELPMNGSLTPRARRQMVDMRQNTLALRKSQAPPANPTNLQVIPQAFGNLVRWTRALASDYHDVLWSTTPSLQNANVVNVGDSAQWTDQVGQSGITRYYWIRAMKYTGSRSLEVGPIKGTTLAAATGVAPTTPPPSSQKIVINQRTGAFDPEYSNYY